MVVNKTDIGVYTGDVGEAEQYPGLQELVDSLTNRANKRYGGMMGTAFAGDQGAKRTSQIEQLAMDMMGYGQQEQSGGIAGALAGAIGNRWGMDTFNGGFGQQGFGADALGALRAWGGGGGGMWGHLKPLGPMKTALQEAQEKAKSAMAAHKLGQQRGGLSGSVTSNITG